MIGGGGGELDSCAVNYCNKFSTAAAVDQVV